MLGRNKTSGSDCWDAPPLHPSEAAAVAAAACPMGGRLARPSHAAPGEKTATATAGSDQQPCNASSASASTEGGWAETVARGGKRVRALLSTCISRLEARSGV